MGIPNHNRKSRRSKTGRDLAIGSGITVALRALVAVAVLVGRGSDGQAAYTCEGDRTIVLDLSSANRSEAAAQAATEIIGELRGPNSRARARARDVDGIDSVVSESIAAIALRRQQ